MDNEQSLTEDEFVNDCNIFQAQDGAIQILTDVTTIFL